MEFVPIWTWSLYVDNDDVSLRNNDVKVIKQRSFHTDLPTHQGCGSQAGPDNVRPVPTRTGWGRYG